MNRDIEIDVVYESQINVAFEIVGCFILDWRVKIIDLKGLRLTAVRVNFRFCLVLRVSPHTIVNILSEKVNLGRVILTFWFWFLGT